MIKKAFKELLESKLTISFAESITGGLLASMLTDQPGSSEIFSYGVVTYSNEMKHQILGISLDVINEFSAVSKEVSELMAKCIKNITNSNIAISVTGNAGPTSLEKSVVGEVYFTIIYFDEIYNYYHYFEKMDRLAVKQGAANKVYSELFKLLQQKKIGKTDTK